MAFLDKRGLIAQMSRLPLVILELGCGARKRSPNYIGVDALDYECVDVVGDAREVLEALPEDSVDEIVAYHFLEHVFDLKSLLLEIDRVLKPGGRLRAVAPHFSNPYYYSDFTHRTFFGLYSLSYFADDPFFKRRVPRYQMPSSLRLLSVTLNFKSSPPFYVRHGIKRLVGAVVNVSRYTQEIYEECFCWAFPCYEVTYLAEKVRLPERREGT